VVHLYLFPAAIFLSASLFVLANNVLIDSALKKVLEKADGALLYGGVQLALCTAVLLPELKPASCFLSAIIGQID